MIRKRLKLVNITKKGKYIQQFEKKKLYSGFVLPFEKKLHKVKLKKQRKTNC